MSARSDSDMPPLLGLINNNNIQPVLLDLVNLIIVLIIHLGICIWKLSVIVLKQFCFMFLVRFSRTVRSLEYGAQT